jgi:type I restriction enzyme M protein
LKVGREVPAAKGQRNYALFGQEANASTWALCKMNMFLHETDSARVERCNTLTDPKLVEDDRLMKFDIVVANPPFSLDKWGAENAAGDRFERYARGIPPKSKADYAFILHMIHIAQADTGKVGVIVPHGVLFRGGAEGKIRKALIEENLLDAVIGLPANLFFGTGIPTAILLFDKGRTTTDVLFIDASREYQDGKNQNLLRTEDLDKVVATHRAYESIDKYAYRATFDEIAENDFNLNIPRYVDTFEEEEEIDIKAVQTEIDGLEEQLAETRKEMAKHLKDLGLV